MSRLLQRGGIAALPILHLSRYLRSYPDLIVQANQGYLYFVWSVLPLNVRQYRFSQYVVGGANHTPSRHLGWQDSA